MPVAAALTFAPDPAIRQAAAATIRKEYGFAKKFFMRHNRLRKSRLPRTCVPKFRIVYPLYDIVPGAPVARKHAHQFPPTAFNEILINVDPHNTSCSHRSL